MSKKRKYKVKVVPLVIAIVVLLLILGILVTTALSLLNKTDDDSKPSSPDSEIITPAVNENIDDISDNTIIDDTAQIPSDTSNTNESDVIPNIEPVNVVPNSYLWDWELLLVNNEAANGLSDELNFSTTNFDTQSMDSRLKEPYTAMYKAAKEDGITLYVRTAYRSMKQQKALYTISVQENMEKGYSRPDAILKTIQTISDAGHCEHQTGLGLDIITSRYHVEHYHLDENYIYTNVYKWLQENAHNYGFIERYPADKIEITQRAYEPWHFRYVGVENALYMVSNNLCLEEYIQLLQDLGR